MPNFRKALLIHFASSSGATAVQFFVSVVLARLLTPEEIGVYSITIVLVNIAHVFREFGVGSYIQREGNLTNEKIRSAMGVAYLSAWLIAAVIYCASGWVAAYFGYAQIQTVMQVLALGFLFIPFSSIMLALLMREYNAQKIAWATVWGTLAYSVTALGLAYNGFGTMSLAWANLANIVATGLAYIPMRPRNLPWVPSLNNIGGIARFGGGALSATLLRNINYSLPDLLLGKMGTAHQVGLMSRANSTVNIFLHIAGSAISFGSEAYLAKAYHAKQSLEPLLAKAAALVTGVGWPALVVIALLGRDIVVFLYGDAWVDSVPAIAPLALAASIHLMFHYGPSAFNAIGRPYLASLPLAVTALSRVALAVAFFSGSMQEFSWILTCATVLTLPVWIFLQQRYLGCRAKVFFGMLLPSLGVAFFCAFVCILGVAALNFFGVSSSFVRVFSLFIPLVCAWVGAVRLFRHPLNSELSLLFVKFRRIFLPLIGVK